MKTLKQLAEEHCVHIKTDNDFQRRARIMQALWRESKGYPIGSYIPPRQTVAQKLGSLLEEDWAQKTRANYLSPNIRQVIQNEVFHRQRKIGQLYDERRIVTNLLSSQPLCFNLFAELQQDLNLTTDVFRTLSQGRIHTVTTVKFEYSPGRGDPRYLNDRSAFDVYLEYRNSTGHGFAGIEVKYHENLNNQDNHKPRYDEVAQIMDCFTDTLPLRKKPFQQIWRDHLLAGSLRHADKFDDGFFVFLYPEDNQNCAEAVENYSKLLSDQSTFQAWTLEQVAGVIKHHTRSTWIDAFIDRYLDFSKIDQLLQES